MALTYTLLYQWWFVSWDRALCLHGSCTNRVVDCIHVLGWHCVQVVYILWPLQPSHSVTRQLERILLYNESTLDVCYLSRVVYMLTVPYLYGLVMQAQCGLSWLIMAWLTFVCCITGFYMTIVSSNTKVGYIWVEINDACGTEKSTERPSITLKVKYYIACVTSYIRRGCWQISIYSTGMMVHNIIFYI